MRLLVVSHPCVTPANQDFFGELMASTGWDVTVVTPNRWKNEYGRQIPERSPGFGGSLIARRVALAGHIPLHFYASSTRAVLRAVLPDAAYLHHEPYGLATAQWAMALGSTPFAVYSAQNIVKHFPLPFAQFERAVLKRARLAVPVSETVADVLRRKGYAGPMEVLPLPVDLARFFPAPSPPAHPTVGYVGRLSPEKGVDVLLRAVANSTTPDLRCLIAGTGPDESRLREEASALGIAERVEWRGYVTHSEVAAFYRELTVLAVPSLTVPNWSEQFGRVVIEAIASGVAVLASDSGELPALLERTGAGLALPEGDHRALAQALDAHAAPDGELVAEARACAPRIGEEFGLSPLARRFAEALVSAAQR